MLLGDSNYNSRIGQRFVSFLCILMRLVHNYRAISASFLDAISNLGRLIASLERRSLMKFANRVSDA